MAGVKRYSRELDISNAMAIPAHDYIANAYDISNNITSIVYKLGGAAGVIVATLVLTYDANGNIATIERTV
jgi:hypothetical protein